MSAVRLSRLTVPAPLRREGPWLVLAVALLVVLLHANAPEVWFWFAALLVLLLWRSLACRDRSRRAAGGEGECADQG